MPTLQQSKRTGFTLIEISITLMVIGLIIGGILIGKELIYAAAMRRLISSHEQFELAVSTFRNKYQCLPGDCAKATEFGLTSSLSVNFASNGTGDGKIEDPENKTFWLHLSKAGLINFTPEADTIHYTCSEGPFATTPCIDGTLTRGFFKAGWWVIHPFDQYGSSIYSFASLPSSHYWWLAGRIGGGSDASAVFTPETARAIDQKIDDGFPISGIVLATGDNNGDPYGFSEPYTGAGGRNSNVCVADDTTPWSYNIQNTSGQAYSLCSMIIRTRF